MEIDALYNCTNNQLHIGKAVRKIFLKSGLSVKQFADMIPCKESNIYKIYERKEIDTSLLKKICKILNYDFFKLYSQELHLEPFDCKQIICNITIPAEDWKEGVICKYCEANKKFKQIIDK